MLARSGAFLRQARSDLDAYFLLARADIPDCHALQSLQMAGEKLGKALRMAAQAQGAAQYSHAAIVKALRLVRNRRSAAAALSGGNRERLRFAVDSCLALANDLERLTPALAHGPNLEYPWLRGVEWIAPADFAFEVAGRLRSSDGARYVAFLERLIARFDAVFGDS